MERARYSRDADRWQPFNNGTGKRIWFLMAGNRYHYGKDGRLVRYASYESAWRAADKLNAAEAEEHL